jgi:hypothetical protein
MTTIGEIQAMEARLPALLARQTLREAEVAGVAASADADYRRGWFRDQAEVADGRADAGTGGAEPSHQLVRERRKAAWERRQAGARGA